MQLNIKAGFIVISEQCNISPVLYTCTKQRAKRRASCSNSAYFVTVNLSEACFHYSNAPMSSVTLLMKCLRQLMCVYLKAGAPRVTRDASCKCGSNTRQQTQQLYAPFNIQANKNTVTVPFLSTSRTQISS